MRVVAARGLTRIVQTRHGFVMAAAGVDASNVRRDELALLPVDSDVSARALRDRIRDLLGIEVAVVVTDTMGRPWRAGLVDAAVGVAGIAPLADERGHADVHGNVLSVTEVAVVDEIAAAADLVKGKLGGLPVAVVRGLATDPDSTAGIGALIRDPAMDMFRLGTTEAIELGRRDADSGRGEAGPLHAGVRRTVIAFEPGPDRGAAAIREGFLTLLDARTDATWRSCLPGHITAGAILVDPSRSAVLLTLHPRVGKWVELGGHCEPADDSPAAAALREAREESGIEDLWLDPDPIRLDIHPIVCSVGVPTRHFNITYVAVAPAGAEPVISDESLDLRWFHRDELPTDAVPDLAAALELAFARLG